jgi:hypothetical protein
MGPVRSTRLPGPLDAWLESRLMLHAHKSASEVIVELIHGGLRLREGYMAVHRRGLETIASDAQAARIYLRALEDTFGVEYIEHLLKWLAADGIRFAGDGEGATHTRA